MSWVAVIGTLAGTIVGMVGTILGQRIAAESAEKRERLQRRAALRVERKVAIDLFFEAAQETERAAAETRQLSDSERGLVAQKLWFRHKQLTLICSDDLREAADNLANLLGPCLWHGAPEWKKVFEVTLAESRAFHRIATSELAALDE